MQFQKGDLIKTKHKPDRFAFVISADNEKCIYELLWDHDSNFYFSRPSTYWIDNTCTLLTDIFREDFSFLEEKKT